MAKLKATVEFYIDTAPSQNYDLQYDTEVKRLQFDLDNEPANVLDASDVDYPDSRTFRVVSVEEV